MVRRCLGLPARFAFLLILGSLSSSDTIFIISFTVREGKLAVANAAQRQKDEAAVSSSSSYGAVCSSAIMVATDLPSIISASNSFPNQQKFDRVQFAPRVIAVKLPPDAVASALRFLTGGYDLSQSPSPSPSSPRRRCSLQANFARVLPPPPSRRHRLITPMAWLLGIATSWLVTSVFVCCLTFGDEIHGGYGGWAATLQSSSCTHAPLG